MQTAIWIAGGLGVGGAVYGLGVLYCCITDPDWWAALPAWCWGNDG